MLDGLHASKSNSFNITGTRYTGTEDDTTTDVMFSYLKESIWTAWVSSRFIIGADPIAHSLKPSELDINFWIFKSLSMCTQRESKDGF